MVFVADTPFALLMSVDCFAGALEDGVLAAGVSWVRVAFGGAVGEFRC